MQLTLFKALSLQHAVHYNEFVSQHVVMCMFEHGSKPQKLRDTELLKKDPPATTLNTYMCLYLSAAFRCAKQLVTTN